LLTTIVFIHGVTSLAALGSIIPEVSDRTARAGLRYAWQSGCGLYACFGGSTVMAQDIETREHDEDDLVDRASPMATSMSSNLPKPACAGTPSVRPRPIFQPSTAPSP